MLPLQTWKPSVPKRSASTKLEHRACMQCIVVTTKHTVARSSPHSYRSPKVGPANQRNRTTTCAMYVLDRWYVPRPS